MCGCLASAHGFCSTSTSRRVWRPSSFVLNSQPYQFSLMSRPSLKLPHLAQSLSPDSFKGRRRSGSIVKVEEVGGCTEELLDRSAYLNINANWVNAKGACSYSSNLNTSTEPPVQVHGSYTSSWSLWARSLLIQYPA